MHKKERSADSNSSAVFSAVFSTQKLEITIIGIATFKRSFPISFVPWLLRICFLYATKPIAISTNMMNTCLISIVTISIYFISCRLRLYYIY